MGAIEKAAPQLYVALKLVSRYERAMDEVFSARTRGIIRNALRKAEGNETSG